MIFLNRSRVIQDMLDFIDTNVKEEISVNMIAENAGYSAYHFSRIFKEATGISLMSYVTWRKLQYALHDLSRGMKVVDTAMEYGFDTHGGFTKAFTRWFGFSPSLCYPRLNVSLPVRMDLNMLQRKFCGGNLMNPHIIELTAFSVIGYPSCHTKENIRNTGDAPTFWNTIDMDYGPLLTELYDTFPKSKHCEISMCYDTNPETGEFSYILGRGIDDPSDLKNIKPGMTRIDIEGGLYAIFSTPPAGDSYVKAAQDTWHDIFLNWLPQSEFEFDETRMDFEYHDKRDHGIYFGGKLQIDICIPIKQREEEERKAQLRRAAGNAV